MIDDSYKLRGLRQKLVKKLAEKGIKSEAVLDAINKVPRHVFFENALIDHAYQDKAFPIGEGQTISQPFTVAFQTEQLEIKPGDKVLEIGTGSGYQACVLLEMGAQLGYKPFFFHGDGSRGVAVKAPYNKIIVTAGAPVVPTALTDQLADGGILIIPVGGRDKQTMVKIRKKGGTLLKEELSTFAFVPLLGADGWRK
jgi:protein-L-isoaspartate(D-aspartate) O-methyltransferase